jgi:DNA repair exonuclease SbcCD ATPase subunit
MTYKFVHLADVHWRGLTRHAEYKRSFEDAFEKMRLEEPNAIFVVGDIVHSKTQGISPELISSLTWWFKELDSIAPTYVSLGNHDGLILNRDREDAITPIVKALGLPRINLLKGASKFEYNSNIDISNFCPFDEESWPNVKPTDGKINIALFHGPVNGCKSDDEWKIESAVGLPFFKGYDFAFLGDIHKRQAMDAHGRFVYCGSTIQQNFGESLGKGFTVWTIDDADRFDSRHVNVQHDSPFVTIDWKGTVDSTLDEAEKHPDGSRFRIRTDRTINQVDIKHLYFALRESKSATEIVIKHELAGFDSNVESVFRNKQQYNLKDPNKVIDLILNFHESSNLSDATKSRIADQIKQYWHEIPKLESRAGGEWSIKKMEFDNTFGYGKGNVIDFDQLEGITGIFGQNRVGKSSVCGTLMYSLFNSTDRGNVSNLHVINARKGYCSANTTISKNGKLYRIERQSVKKETKKGELSAVTHLNLFEIDEQGNQILDLADEQRRETDKVLRDIVGYPEDFLLTAFASQGEMNAFLEQKATARKNVLSRFLELDIFDHIQEAVKNDSSGLRQHLKSLPDKDYENLILLESTKLESKKQMRKSEQKSLEDIRKQLSDFEIKLAKRDDSSLITRKDYDKVKGHLESLKSKEAQLESKLTATIHDINEIKAKIDKIEAVRNDFPLESLKEELKDQREIQSRIKDVKHSIDKEKQKQKMLDKQVEVLQEVPCGDQFLTCPFITNAHKAKTSLKATMKKTEELSMQLDEIKLNLSKSTIQDLESRIEKYDELIRKLNDFKLKLSKLEKEEISFKNDGVNVQENIKSTSDKLNSMLANLASDEETEILNELNDQLGRMRREEKEIDSRVRKLSEEIGLIQSNIEKLHSDKETHEQLMEKWTIYDLISQATSKNGVPLELIRRKLPEINAEIAQILQGVTTFTVELESEDGSSNMEIYLNYGDSKRVIECCSGMEKMLSAMAIRVALTNVSQLSKPDVFIVDEGFGALDASNIEACNRLLESLKKWFKCILIISHIDAVKDAVDNVIEIERVNQDARIKQK